MPCIIRQPAAIPASAIQIVRTAPARANSAAAGRDIAANATNDAIWVSSAPV